MSHYAYASAFVAENVNARLCLGDQLYVERFLLRSSGLPQFAQIHNQLFNDYVLRTLPYGGKFDVRDLTTGQASFGYPAGYPAL